MQRLSTVLLALLAAVVVAGAGLVIARNGDRSSGAAPTGATTTSAARPTPSVSSSASSSAAVPVVAFLGDDWTRGKRATSSDRRFTSLVAAALHVRERTVAVDGAGYATPKSYADLVGAVVATHPDVVVVGGGRNDVVADRLGTAPIGDAAAAARVLFATLHRRLPGARLVAVRPTWGDSAAPAELDTLAAAVASAVRRAGGTYLDLPDPIRGHPGFMADDADPDDRGYAALAAALEPELRPLLPR